MVMANFAKKSSGLFFILIGVIIVLVSALFQAVYISYVGLGIIFWGIILRLIITELPSTPEAAIQEEYEEVEVRLRNGNDVRPGLSQNLRLPLENRSSENLAQPIQQPVQPISQTIQTIQQTVVQPTIVQVKLIEPTFNDYVRYIQLRTTGQTQIGEPKSINTEEPPVQDSYFEEKDTQTSDNLENREMPIREAQFNTITEKRIPPPPPSLTLPGNRYYNNKELDRKADEAFAALELGRQAYEKYLELNNTGKFDLLRYIREDVRKCPLRRSDIQDCFFCEAKNCQDRKL